MILYLSDLGKVVPITYLIIFCTVLKPAVRRPYEYRGWNLGLDAYITGVYFQLIWCMKVSKIHKVWLSWATPKSKVIEPRILLLLGSFFSSCCKLLVLNCNQLLHRSVSRKAKALHSLIGPALTLKYFGFCLCGCLLVLLYQKKKKTISKLTRKWLPTYSVQMAFLDPLVPKAVLMMFLLSSFFILFKMHSQPYSEISIN